VTMIQDTVSHGGQVRTCSKGRNLSSRKIQGDMRHPLLATSLYSIRACYTEMLA
jgi:hypothetical protein